MATYPIKMLKDEHGDPFVPLVSTECVADPGGQSLDQKLANKLESSNIIAGSNISVSTSGNDVTITASLPPTGTLIDNLTTTTAGQGALDAHQGYELKEMIPVIVDDVTDTSATKALSANQGYLLNAKFGDYLPLVGGTCTGNVTAPKFIGALQGNADTATGATNDGNGDQIDTTYLKLSGGTLTGNLEVTGTLSVTKNVAIPKNGGAGYGLTNSSGSSIIRDHNNNNVTVDATGGTLYLGYENTTGLNFINGKGTYASDGTVTFNKGALTNLIIKRTEGANAAVIQFQNTNGALGAIGMTGTANGRLQRWNKDYSTGYEIIDRSIVTNNTSKTHTNYNNNQTNIPTMNTLTFWNGAYNSSGSSNLTYAHQGTIQCKPTNLYNNTSGTNGNVTLSQTSANFAYLEIFFGKGEIGMSSVKVQSPNGKKVCLSQGQFVPNGSVFQNISKMGTISGTNITFSKAGYGNVYSGGIEAGAENQIYVYRIDGYK